MKLLLDTDVLMWALSEPERIKPKVQNLLIDADNIMVLFKCCFFMGITNKKSLNKISLPTDFISQLQENGFNLLDINYKNIVTIPELPLLHRDLFDRMLIAKAINDEDVSLITSNSEITKYDVRIITN